MGPENGDGLLKLVLDIRNSGSKWLGGSPPNAPKKADNMRKTDATNNTQRMDAVTNTISANTLSNGYRLL